MSLTRANSVRLRRRLAQLENSLREITEEVLVESVDEFVDNIENELSAIDVGTQVGFDIGTFVESLRFHARQVSEEEWQIDMFEAGGDSDDFEQIAGEHLWHEGTNRSAAFERFIYERADAREALAEERQAIWGDKAPQWYILNYGGGAPPVGPMAPSHFVERALDFSQDATIARIKRKIEMDVED